MKDDLLKLVDLEKIDYDIYKMTCQQSEAPKEMELLKLSQERLKSKWMSLKDALKHAEMERKNKEIEVQGNEAKIAKNDQQLGQIKKNDEYKAMLQQMEDLKKANGLLEEKILMSMEDIDRLNKEIREEDKIVQEEMIKFKQREAEVHAALKNIDDNISQLKEKRNALFQSLTQPVRTTYQQIIEKRKDRALAPVADDIHCGACFMVLQPHIVDEARSGKKIVRCDTCSRMLYHPDLLAQLKTQSSEVI